MNKLKDKRIQTKQDTAIRRSGMKRIIVHCKIQKNKLSKSQIKHLILLFLEQKWFKNYLISQPDLFKADYKITKVPVATYKIEGQQQYELRSIEHLSSQSKQATHNDLKDNVKMLSTKKQNGNKVGKLKFKSEAKSIHFPQYIAPKTHSGGYKIHFKNSKLQLAKIPFLLSINGLDQIPLVEGLEFGEAILIHEAGDFYINITCYVPYDQLPKKKPNNNKEPAIGIDLGMETQLTLSNGIKIQYEIPVSERTKRNHKNISRTKKHSKNRRKQRTKLQKSSLHENNQKKDIRKKLLSVFKNNYHFVITQNDNIKGWQKLGGSKIQSTAIGSILAELKNNPAISIIVDRWFASTQTCPDCGVKTKISLDERIFICSNKECSFTQDRDIKSAVTIADEGMKGKVVHDLEHTLYVLSHLKKIPHIDVKLVGMDDTDLESKDLKACGLDVIPAMISNNCQGQLRVNQEACLVG